jgi:hypothetical protein
MSKEDDEKMEARREAVFKAGAEAASPSYPEFEGRTDLGSMERCTWYDGYASAHPEFKNPYRRLR